MEEENLSIDEFLKKYHKGIYQQYARYCNRHELPTVGDEYVTLRPGYSGPSGEYVRIDRIYMNEPYGVKCIDVTNLRNGAKCICVADEWWIDLRRRTEEDR